MLPKRSPAIVVASGEVLEGVFIVGGAPIGVSRELLTAPPYSFTIEIPKTINSGPYNLTTEGRTASRSGVRPDTITVDVERANSPIELRVELPFLLVHVGEKTFPTVIGVFGDSTTAEIKESTLTTFRSDNVAVATVGRYGLVTGVAPGSAKIIIVNGKASVEVPVTVLRNNEN